ncbi:F-box/kelch-repeat protein At1g23390-like [Macadamia integrifolia]|uniref:F-box/kelch-repeat protein At1g23390-like n=1 Tax=Macadamia integrifolia TaxID=60698 RepID=UPI001C4F4E4F|nr:F-box/kelch-repeat protein At1g23390-like [Macadamia integrifolia]
MAKTAKTIPQDREKTGSRQGDEAQELLLLLQEAPIHGDVLETILTRLPMLDMVAASRVSKAWRGAVSTSLRISPRVKPWFIVYTLHHRNHSLTSACAFDPASRVWLRIDIGDVHQFTTNTIAASTASPALRSSHSQHLLYKLSAGLFSFSFDALHLAWHKAEAPQVWRQDPIVARLGSRVLVAGGTCDFVDDPLAVEMYDTGSRRWETCEPMPELLKDSATSTWLSTAATNSRLYLLEKRSRLICSFDAETKTWGPTFNLILNTNAPVAVFHSIIGFAGDRLVLVGLMGEPEELQGLGLWEVDQVTYECRKLGEMPPAMVESLRNANSRLSTPSASMEGDFIYVYNPSNPEQIFFCELKEGKCQWGEAMNPMTNIRSRMHRFVFTCSRVGMGDLQKAMATGNRRLTVESE